MKNMLIEIFKPTPIEITLEEALETPFIVRVFRSVVRVFSGLM